MPSSKDKGNDKGLSKKKAAARRVQTRSISTKSKKQARIEEAQFDTLATVSSPKLKSTPKKLTPPSESTASLLSTVGEEKTPERRKSIAQPVRETKQDNIEEEEAKSTGSDSSHSSVNQVGNSTGDKSVEKEGSQNEEPDGEEIPVTQANMSTLFDTKLKHVLNNYLIATGADHDIRKAFIHEHFFTFEDFTRVCDV